MNNVAPRKRTGAEYALVRAEMETWYGDLWHRSKWWLSRVWEWLCRNPKDEWLHGRRP